MTMFAYDYPLLGVFWTMLWWFLFFAWLMLLFKVFGDIFRNREMGGLAKALWSIFVIIIPWLGVLIYLIAHGRGMGERDYKQAQAQEQAFRSYVQEAAGTTAVGPADELAKLADLKNRGVITDAEFQQQKSKLLA
jgi:hypothetical protein